MAELEVLVARHGQTDWNRDMMWQGRSDIPLNEQGIRQAMELGESLKSEHLTRIYSSDLKRARRTAEIVAEIIGVTDLRTVSGLRERFLGKFEGWKSADVAKFMGMPEKDYHLLETDELSIDGQPEVEPWTEFKKRIWDSFLSISNGGTEGKSLIVAHGGVLRALSATIHNSDKNFPYFQNCQIVRIVKSGSGWILK